MNTWFCNGISTGGMSRMLHVKARMTRKTVGALGPFKGIV